jgi:hypothetical protein
VTKGQRTDSIDGRQKVESPWPAEARWLRCGVSLLRQPEAQATSPLVERPLSALEDFTHLCADFRILQPAACVTDSWQRTRQVITGVGDDHLICICVDDEVRVVRHDHDLATRPRRTKPGNELIEYRFGIQVLLRLIDDQRPFVELIDRQVTFDVS